MAEVSENENGVDSDLLGWTDNCLSSSMDFGSWIQLSEVRLSPASACRAWSAAHGCYNAVEWNAAVEAMPFYRKALELARLSISETLSVDGVDPMGILRKLLIHETTASLSRSWLREVGFVHLEAASGIHLYCIWRSLEGFLRIFSERVARNLSFVRSLVFIRVLRTLLPLAVWFLVWGLSGFRPGLLRPLVLVLFRWGADRFGIRWRKGVALSFALLVDAGFGFIKSYGENFSFIDWAPGELHYAASWWGGIYGYEWARAKGLGSFRAHAALSFFSWLAVVPLDLWDGRFAIFTPVLSLLTVEVLVRGGFVAFVGVGLAVAFTPSPDVHAWFTEGLGWMSFIWSTGVGWVAGILSGMGAIRGF